ncbi:MAG TPA: phosphotransferase family protein, partial [Acidimicrobiales bacterium]|nr:phosphotransferase family protein [Acidimicrobiales bacterium]
MQDPTGFQVANVTAWLVDHVPDLTPPLRWTKLPGGHSNFTFRVNDAADRPLVVRRPPLGDLLPTAHDMGREFTMISALWPTPVPVPEPIAFCGDKSVTGANFYAMGWVEGRALYTAVDAEEHLSVEARAVTGPSFIDTLAALHAVDPDEVGLGGLAKRDSYVGRQLHRWYASWNASKNRELPDVDRLHSFLVERLPEQSKVSVVHGDYGLHNCRVAAAGHIAAVVDWEISTLGDPMADLAYCINTWIDSGDEIAGRPDAPTVLPGFCRRQDLLERYANRSDLDLTQIDYYCCFNHWKTACIVQGVYARYLHGQKDAEDVDVDAFPERVD